MHLPTTRVPARCWWGTLTPKEMGGTLECWVGHVGRGGRRSGGQTGPVPLRGGWEQGGVPMPGGTLGGSEDLGECT